MSGLVDALEPFRVELKLLREGELDLDAPLSKGIGSEHGVVGLLDAVLEAAGTNLEFDPSLGGTAAKLYRRARSECKPALAGIFRVYRDVTRMYPDILGTGYGGTADDFEEFRRSIVPRLLTAVERWAAEHDLAAVRPVQDLREAWEAAVGATES